MPASIESRRALSLTMLIVLLTLPVAALAQSKATKTELRTSAADRGCVREQVMERQLNLGWLGIGDCTSRTDYYVGGRYESSRCNSRAATVVGHAVLVNSCERYVNVQAICAGKEVQRYRLDAGEIHEIEHDPECGGSR